MDLEEFVSSALTQIARGISKAQSDAANTGAWINPAGRMVSAEPGGTIEVDENILSRLDNVQFDVAVTASDEQRADAKAGLKIAVLAGLGASGSVSYQNAAVSRVQFRVPVVWPSKRNEELERKRAETRARDNEAIRKRTRTQPRY